MISPRLDARLGRELARLVRTTDAAWPTILRLTVGGIMLPHALQKTLGAYGGDGFSKTVQLFNAYLGLPAALAVLVIFVELIGSLGLLLGLFTRPAALGIAAVMLCSCSPWSLRSSSVAAVEADSIAPLPVGSPSPEPAGGRRV